MYGQKHAATTMRAIPDCGIQARMNARSVTTLCSLLLVACNGAPTEPTDDGVPAAVRALGVRNLRSPMPNVYTAGQPTEEQLAALSDLGVRRVVHLRLATENGTGWEEQKAPELHVDFVRLPINGTDGLSLNNVRTFAATLAEGRGQPTLVSCGSSNRVGALFALKAYWLDGKTPEEALQIGKDAGMTRMEEPVRALLQEPRPEPR